MKTIILAIFLPVMLLASTSYAAGGCSGKAEYKYCLNCCINLAYEEINKNCNQTQEGQKRKCIKGVLRDYSSCHGSCKMEFPEAQAPTGGGTTGGGDVVNPAK